jgi:hypothetical protein
VALLFLNQGRKRNGGGHDIKELIATGLKTSYKPKQN